MPSNPKLTRIRDRKYLDSFRDRACDACLIEDGTVVAAHVRTGGKGGMGMKPDDSLVFALCHRCHADQEANPGWDWWGEKVIIRWLRERYYDFLRDKT